MESDYGAVGSNEDMTQIKEWLSMWCKLVPNSWIRKQLRRAGFAYILEG